MKKKKIMIATMLVGIVLVIVGSGLGRVLKKNKSSMLQGNMTGTEPLQLTTASNQLMAMADSRQEAERIAGLYGITLVEYSSKVATYHTEEDPKQLIQSGKEKGYPPLFINYSYSLWEE